MEFRILGNLELVSNGEVIDLGGNRLRAFAASVLIHVCEPVTYDKLSSYIWDEPPSPAPANLRTYATALRRKLAVAERGADRWLRTTSGTYQLIIDPKIWTLPYLIAWWLKVIATSGMVMSAKA